MDNGIRPFMKIPGYPVVACQHCLVGVFANAGKHHIAAKHGTLYSQQDATRIGLALWEFGKEHSIVATREDARAVSKMPEAVPEIAELGRPGEDGLGCRYCQVVLAGDHASTSMGTHLRTRHRSELGADLIEGESRYAGHYEVGIPYQKMFSRGAGSLPFRVVPLARTPGPADSPLAVWLQDGAWWQYYHEMSPETTLRRSDPPVAGEALLYKAVKLGTSLVHWMFTEATPYRVADCMCDRALARAEVEGLLGNRLLVTRRAIHMHAQLLGHVVLHFGRTRDSQKGLRGQWRPTTPQNESFGRLLHQASLVGGSEHEGLSYPHSFDSPASQAIVDFVVALMEHEMLHEGPLSVVHSTIATLALGEDRIWRSDLSLVPAIAGILSIGCMAVLTRHEMSRATYLQCEGSSLNPCEVDTLQEGLGSSTLMQWLKDVVKSDGKAAVEHSEILPLKPHWDGETVSVEGRSFSGIGIRRMARELVSQLEGAMVDLLHLRGRRCLCTASGGCRCSCCELPVIPWADIVDDCDGDTASHDTFIEHSDRRNGEAQFSKHRMWISQRIQSSKNLRERWLVGDEPSYLLASIREYGVLIDVFLSHLAACFYFLAGPPPSPEELAFCRWRDGRDVSRNIEVRDGLVYLVFDEWLGCSTSPRARALPPSVASCVVWYIWLVIPFEQQLAASIDDRAESSHFLFVHSRLSGGICANPAPRSSSYGSTSNRAVADVNSGMSGARPGQRRRSTARQPRESTVSSLLGCDSLYFEVEDGSSSRSLCPEVALGGTLGEALRVKTLSIMPLQTLEEGPQPECINQWSRDDVRKLVAQVLARFICPRAGVRCWELAAESIARRFLRSSDYQESPSMGTWLELGSCGVKGMKYCRWGGNSRPALGKPVVALLESCHQWHTLLGVCRIAREGQLPCAQDAPLGDGSSLHHDASGVVPWSGGGTAWPTCPGKLVKGYRPLSFLPGPVHPTSRDASHPSSQLTSDSNLTPEYVTPRDVSASYSRHLRPLTAMGTRPYSPRTIWNISSSAADWPVLLHTGVGELLPDGVALSSLCASRNSPRPSICVLSLRQSPDVDVDAFSLPSSISHFELGNQDVVILDPVESTPVPYHPAFQHAKRARSEPGDGVLQHVNVKHQKVSHDTACHDVPVLSSASGVASSWTFMDAKDIRRGRTGTHRCSGAALDLFDMVKRAYERKPRDLYSVIRLLLDNGSRACAYCVAHGPPGGSCCADVEGPCEESAFTSKLELERQRVMDGISPQFRLLFSPAESYITCMRCLRPWHPGEVCGSAERFAVNLLLALCHRLGRDAFDRVRARYQRSWPLAASSMDSLGCWGDIFKWLTVRTAVGLKVSNLWLFIALLCLEILDSLC